MTEKKLHADTSHAFVQAVKQYVEEGLLEEEFKRRARVFAAKQSGYQEHAFVGSTSYGGGRPNLTADETSELASNIINGRTVPEPVQVYNLGVQFGFIRKQLTDFLNLGGTYFRDCAQRAEGERRIRQEVFPEGETVREALSAILRTRKCGRRMDRLFAEGDSGYNETGKRTPSIAQAFGIVFKHKAAAIQARLDKLAEGYWRNRVDPYSILLSPDEINELKVGFSLTTDEQERIIRANERLRVRMDEICGPAAQEQEIKHILSLYSEKELPYHEEGAAKLALIDILHVRGKYHTGESGGAVYSYGKELKPDTLVFRPPPDTPENKRVEAVHAFLTEHNLDGFDKIWGLVADLVHMDAGILRATHSGGAGSRRLANARYTAPLQDFPPGQGR